MPTIDFRKFEDLSRAVMGTELAVRQVSKTPVSGWATHHEVGDAICSGGMTKGNVEFSGVLHDERVTLGFLHTRGGPTRQYRRPAPNDALVIFPPGEEGHSYYAGTMHYIGLALQPDKILDFADKQELALVRRVLGKPLALVAPQEITNYATQLITLLKGQDELGSPTVFLNDCVDELLSAYIKALDGHGEMHTGGRAYDRIVRRAIDAIVSDPVEILTVNQLSEACAIPRLTLHRAFRSELDVSPGDYLRSLRLSIARQRIISDVRSGSSTISAVAVALGFNELGKFAGYYRRAFGELPSESAENHGSL